MRGGRVCALLPASSGSLRTACRVHIALASLPPRRCRRTMSRRLPLNLCLCFDCARAGADIPASFVCKHPDTCVELPLCEPHGAAHTALKHELDHLIGCVWSKCVAHRGDLRMYCLTDMALVCATCVAEAHPPAGHRVLELTPAIAEVVGMLKERLHMAYTPRAEASTNVASVLTRLMDRVSVVRELKEGKRASADKTAEEGDDGEGDSRLALTDAAPAPLDMHHALALAPPLTAATPMQCPWPCFSFLCVRACARACVRVCTCVCARMCVCARA